MLRQMLDARGWSGDELADITGFARTHLSGVMSGKVGVSADMAVALAAAFGNQAADWLRWNAEYQLSLVPADDRTAVEERARLYELAPIREMQKRGWISPTESADALRREVENFFGGPLDETSPLPVATFKSNPLTSLTPSEKAWCMRARQMAAALTVAEFDVARIDKAEKTLRRLAAYPKEIQRLPENLAYFGVRFVVVEPLAGSRIDGAAFWIDESPVIAISARLDRIDAFWFTVMHEFMHIKNADALSVDVNLLQETDRGVVISVSEETSEQRANAQAADALVPQAELDSFIRRISPLYAAARIVQFAHRIKMHPGVIVGQLQHRGELRYSAHRDFLVKVRGYIIDSALTDGWGRSVGPNVT
jgi:HTH-type transcriptional regulator/antitoxin HigA